MAFTDCRSRLPERRLLQYFILLAIMCFVVHFLLFRNVKLVENQRQIQYPKERQNPIKTGTEPTKKESSEPTKPQEIKDSPAAKFQKFMVKSYNKLGQVPYSRDLDWMSLIDEAFEQQKSKADKNKKKTVSSSHLVENLVIWLKLNVKQKMGIKKVSGNVTEKISAGPKINLATVICGADRKQHGLTMIKSASLFAQDALLNVIVFSDAATIVDLGMDILQLRWAVNVAGWDFTFELHSEEYPAGLNSTGELWRKKYKACEALPVLFPILLPHIDSLIYLDKEVVVLSNLTELWYQATTGMGDKLAGAAAHSEPNSVNYYTYSKLPHVGKQGISAGVMLMNLAQMRHFNFTDRAFGVQEAYAEQMKVGFQDVVNAIFHVYDDRLHWLSCTFNFYFVHCEQGRACNRNTKRSTCFCEDARKAGVHLIYGCADSFSKLGSDHFIAQAYSEFENFDVIHERPLQLLARIGKDFEAEPKCYSVTYGLVYKNARVYLENLQNKTQEI